MSGWLDQFTQKIGEDPLSTLLDQVPGGIVGTDAQGKIVYANAAVGTLLGRKAVSLLGLAVEKALGFQAGGSVPVNAEERELTLAGAEGRELTLGVRRYPTTAGETWMLRDLTDVAFLRKGLLTAEYREQRRLAQVLHDQLSQQLLGAAFSAKMLAIQLERQPPLPSIQEMNDLARLVNECGAQLREVTADPATRAAAEGDLLLALREMARQQHRATVEIMAPDETQIDLGRVTTVVYGLCCEAVGSAVTAGASRITVLIRLREDTLSLKLVSDDTTANELTLEPPSEVHRLYEFRCQAVGVSVSFHAGGGTGSSITLSIPLQP